MSAQCCRFLLATLIYCRPVFCRDGAARSQGGVSVLSRACGQSGCVSEAGLPAESAPYCYIAAVLRSCSTAIILPPLGLF
jgi:hypothetical protein